MQRRREIGRVLVRHGFAWLMVQTGLGDALGWVTARQSPRAVAAVAQPERVRLALEELGPTFIKLGQMLSTRPDLLPSEYIAELSKLQDAAPRVPYVDIAAVVAAELGGPPDEVFKEFAPAPRAAASIGQVHDARLPDGTAVVVKVQRPAIEPIVEDDLAILAQVARLLTANSPLGKRYDLEGYVAECAATLRNELDYVREGRNADRIRGAFAGDPVLHVPAVHWDFTTRRVLTMEAVEGVKIGDLAALEAAGLDRHALAERCAHIAMEQVLNHRFFHADPHPGNFLVQSDGVIALLDYGMVAELDDRLAQSLVRLGMAISHEDADRLVDELLSMGAAPGPVDRDALGRDAGRLLRRYSGLRLGELSAQQIFADGAALARRHRLQMPSDLTMLARVIVMDEGLGTSLDPGFNLVEFARPYFQQFWRRSHSLRSVSRRLREGALDLAEVGEDLPQRLRRLLIHLERGELTVTSRLELPEQTAARFEAAANRLAVSVLAAAAVIGLSVLAAAVHPAGSSLSTFLLRSTLAAGVACCVWLIAAFWRSRR